MLARATALRRLAAVALLAALGWALACRPTWSPDSSTVVFPSVLDQRLALARYRLGDEAAELLVTSPEKQKRQLAAHWLPGGKELLVLTHDPGNSKVLQVERRPVDGREPVTFAVPTPEDAIQHTLLPPVVHQGALYLGGKSVIRVDLTSGEQRSGGQLEGANPGEAGEIVLARCGDGICYLQQTDDQDRTRWAVGSVDPEKLTRKLLFEAPVDNDWEVLPMPGCSPDGRRLALPATRGLPESREAAILVFEAGKLLHTIPVSGTDARLGGIAWGKDGVTLVTTLVEMLADGNRFTLIETDFAGNALRRTDLFTVQGDDSSSQMLPFSVQAALSPDQQHVAISTAYLHKMKDPIRGLLLIDRRKTPRKVQRIPFPQVGK